MVNKGMSRVKMLMQKQLREVTWFPPAEHFERQCFALRVCIAPVSSWLSPQSYAGNRQTTPPSVNEVRNNTQNC